MCPHPRGNSSRFPASSRSGSAGRGLSPRGRPGWGTIAAEKGIGKIGTEAEFYERFDPDRIATQIVTESREEIRESTTEVIAAEYPELWHNAPEPIQEFIHARVEDRFPRVTEGITETIGENIDELPDINQMIAGHLDRNPELINQIFLEVGDRELNFIGNSGFYIGTFLGLFSIPLFLSIDQWWVLPVCGVAVGYLINWIALNIIFRPIREYKFGPVRLQGLFSNGNQLLRRSTQRLSPTRS